MTQSSSKASPTVPSKTRIWDKVCTTDPAYTKPVKIGQGRPFTAIDAHYTVLRATQVLGPVGEGWAWHAEYSTIETSDTVLAVADVLIEWHDQAGGPPRQYGPVRCINKLVSPDRNGKPHVDEDAFKKAMTDALTKGLSHLGFSADVYLGKFDDSRYVEEQRVRHQEPAPDQVGPLLKELKDHLFAEDKNGVLACIALAKEQGLKMQIWNSLNQDERNILSNLLGVSAS